MKKKATMILAATAAAVTVFSFSGCSVQNTATNTAATSAPESDNNNASAAAVLTEAKTTQYFTDEKVADDDVKKILEAGINAPSGMNSQPWHFTAVTDEATLTEIANAMSAMMPSGAAASNSSTRQKAGLADAPLAIFVSCTEDNELNAGLACQNMSAEAQLLGYGTKILSSPSMILNGDNKAQYDSMLSIPEGQSFAAVLLVGKADDSVDQNADGVTGASTRNPFDDVVTMK